MGWLGHGTLWGPQGCWGWEPKGREPFRQLGRQALTRLPSGAGGLTPNGWLAASPSTSPFPVSSSGLEPLLSSALSRHPSLPGRGPLRWLPRTSSAPCWSSGANSHGHLHWAPPPSVILTPAPHSWGCHPPSPSPSAPCAHPSPLSWPAASSPGSGSALLLCVNPCLSASLWGSS